MAVIDRSHKDALDHQFERISWALFLIMIGGLALLPDVPGGTWLIGTGLIMLGLNLARQRNGIRPSAFTIVLGIVAVVTGVAEVAGAALPVFPLLLILIGASILWRALLDREPAA
jgi:hypothetical protein